MARVILLIEDVKLVAVNDPFITTDYMEDCGVVHVEDLESIVDASKRAYCERRALNLAKMLLKERHRFNSIDHVITSIQDISSGLVLFRNIHFRGNQFFHKLAALEFWEFKKVPSSNINFMLLGQFKLASCYLLLSADEVSGQGTLVVDVIGQVYSCWRSLPTSPIGSGCDASQEWSS